MISACRNKKKLIEAYGSTARDTFTKLERNSKHD
jgi:hypothetical protein